MTIGTSDGKSYKNEMSYLLDQHNNLSQEAQVADLDRRTPPPLPMVPSHSIAPHNPNPPGGGPYQIRPGERLADTALDPMPNIPSPPIVPKEWPPHPLNPTRVSQIIEDVKTPLPRPDPRKGELGMQDSTTPTDPLDPLFDNFLKTQSDVPIKNPTEWDKEYRMPKSNPYIEKFLRRGPDKGNILEQPNFPVDEGEPLGRDIPKRRNTPKERLTGDIVPLPMTPDRYFDKIRQSPEYKKLQKERTPANDNKMEAIPSFKLT